MNHPVQRIGVVGAGLETVQAIAESMYDEYKEPLHSPPPLLARVVQAGLLGCKSGRGFHDHGADAGEREKNSHE